MQWRVFHDTATGRGNDMDICENSNFQWYCVNSTTGSNVFKAWQFVAAHGFTYYPKVAVIDGGFWLDPQGQSLLDASGGTTLMCQGDKSCPEPHHPWQYNFINNTDEAYGANQGTCLNNSSCPFHGNGAANVAIGNVGYQHDGAGTGGQVADPILFYTDGSAGEMAKAVNAAAVWGADVISISSTTDCGQYGSWWCRHFSALGGYQQYAEAIDNVTGRGVLVVSSAGNSSGSSAQDASSEFPCYYGPVLCVGALGDGQVTPLVTGVWSSDFGPSVKIWAPTNIPVINVQPSPNTTVPGMFAGTFLFGGTSASAPFVAGIAAMVKAMNPNLTGAQILDLLTATAYGHAVDDEVVDMRRQANGDVGNFVLRVNAYNAVVQAAGGYNLAPDVHIVNPSDNPDYISNANNAFVSQTFQAWAYDIQDSGPDGATPLPANDFHWSITAPSSNANILQPVCIAGADGCLTPLQGSPFDVVSENYDFTNEQPGPRTMTVTATNSTGLSASTSVVEVVSFVNDAPQPVITSPPGTALKVQVGVPVLLEGYARDSDPGALIGWTPCTQMQWITSLGTFAAVPSASYQQSGLCQSTVTFQSAGPQRIQLNAWNRLNQVGTASITINVVPVSSNFDFSLGLSAQANSIITGTSTSIAANVSLITGTPQLVTLSVAGVPVGMNYTISPNPADPSYTSVLTFIAGTSTLAGEYNLTIIAAGGEVTRTATFGLYVEYPAQ